VDIAGSIEACRRGTRHYSPEQLAEAGERVLAGPANAAPGRIEVVNETTLSGIARLFVERGPSIAALNFASAKNPGGGFSNGSQAQEESLARSSALYASLLQAPEFYHRHRNKKSCLYSDAMILSPACPIFRNDLGELLERPIAATFITSAAPNAGANAADSPDHAAIPETLHRRAELVLTLAAQHGCSALVLGAWGCGVFRNDPRLVAATFADLLGPGRPWSTRFERLVFSIFEPLPAGPCLSAFREQFSVSS
jgi:uncharacterized protein (TIGR02452 family)